MGAHLVLGRLDAVVDALGHTKAVAEHLHLGILFLLIGDGGIGPGIMQRHGERADEDDVLAFLAHLLGDQVHVGLAVGLDRGQLEIPVVVLLVGTFVREHLDAGFLGAAEDRGEGGRVVRHDADDGDLAGDEVFDGPHLLRRVGLGRADHPCVDTEIGRFLLDADFHGVEPRNTADLDDDADLRIGCTRGKHRAAEGGRKHRTANACQKCPSIQVHGHSSHSSLTAPPPCGTGHRGVEPRISTAQ